jgi:hypothetical protein
MWITFHPKTDWEVDAQSGRDTSAILSRKLVMTQEPLPYAITFECVITLHNVLLFPIPAIRHGIQTWELCSWRKQLLLLSPFSFQVPAKMSKDTANKTTAERTQSLFAQIICSRFLHGSTLLWAQIKDPQAAASYMLHKNWAVEKNVLLLFT